jgi:NaMN:DMB phosphoribosyltransferase
MAITNSLLTTGAAANVYVSTGSSAITAMYLCNIDTTARTFDIYVCPSGMSITQANTRIYSGVQIQAGDTYVVDSEKLILSSGDMIKANTSSASAIAMTVSFIGI